MEKLRIQTRQAHEELEQEMLPLIDGIDGPAAYAGLLGIFHQYYGHLEQRIDRYGVAVLPDYGSRRKAAWIMEDLRQIDQTVLPVQPGMPFPEVSSAAEAMGALYVMEGSTLGGKHISRMIASSLGLNGGLGLRFFAAYQAENGSRWKAFLHHLEQFDGSEFEAQVIGKANEVFAGFRALLQDYKTVRSRS